MRNQSAFLVRGSALLSVVLAAMPIGAAAPNLAPIARVPVLLELFTSEGCSSCPPADRLLANLDRHQPVPGVDLIVMSEHVDYWNQLGWTDPNSSSAFSMRQLEYVKRLNLDDAYTPQLIVDGKVGLVGSNAKGALAAARQAMGQQKAPVTLSLGGQDEKHLQVHLQIGPLPPGSSNRRGAVFIALAKDQVHTNVVKGENAGRLLDHVAVVYKLWPLRETYAGTDFEKDITIPLAGGANNSRIIAFVQDKESLRVLGAVQYLP